MTTQMKTMKNELKILACRNINTILDLLGVNYSRRGLAVSGKCPAKNHPGDNDNLKAFSWRDDYEHWVCFSHHCEMNSGSDILGLISAITGFDFGQTIKWLDENKFKFTNAASTPVNINNNKYVSSIFIHKPLEENRIKFITANNIHPYLLSRGFDKSICDEFNIGFWSRPGTFMHDRIIVPIRDHDGRLVGFSGRTIYPESEWPKRKITEKWIHGRYYDRWPQPDELKIGSILFNLNNANKFIDFYERKLILVEGPFDGLKLQMAGIKNWAANLGGKFTAQKRNLLVRYGYTDIICAFDNDLGGDDAFKHFCDVSNDLFRIKRAILPAGKDPGDLSVDEIVGLSLNAIT